MPLNPYKIFLILFQESFAKEKYGKLQARWKEKWESRFIMNMEALTVLIAIGCGGG